MRSIRERLEALSPRAIAPVERSNDGPDLLAVLGGELIGGSQGSFFVRRHQYAPADLPLVSLDSFDVRASTGLLNAADRRVDCRLDDLLFLDTEATGLSGGAGSRAFLVGIGRFADEGLVVEQYFTRSPADERAVLDYLRPLLERHAVLVTFNGKSFDWPLLESRFILHGHRFRPAFAHLDLIHPARRIWKERLASCSLGSLERAVLGVRRSGDIPSYLVPQVYFDYLRRDDPRPLRPVFDHNRQDILSLIGLTRYMAALSEQADRLLRHPLDRASYGRWLVRQGDLARGSPFLTEAFYAENLPTQLRLDCGLELWRALKRAGQADAGVALLVDACRIASRHRPTTLDPHVELAKHLEHGVGDYRRAIRVVEHALRLLEIRAETQQRRDLLHRLGRLNARLTRLDQTSDTT